MSKVPKKISTSELNASPKYAGFTLLECLATLSMLSLIFLMLSGVFTQSQEINRRIQRRQELEWHVFLVQLENQFSLGTFKSVGKSELVFNRTKLHEGKQVTFVIKRSQDKQAVYLSDNGGVEPLLTQVTNLVFERQGNTILFTITFTNGEIKSGQWTIPQVSR